MLRQPLVFEHVKERGFAGVIEAKKEDFGIFLPETEGGKDAIEPIEEKHDGEGGIEGQRKGERFRDGKGG